MINGRASLEIRLPPHIDRGGAIQQDRGGRRGAWQQRLAS